MNKVGKGEDEFYLINEAFMITAGDAGNCARSLIYAGCLLLRLAFFGLLAIFLAGH